MHNANAAQKADAGAVPTSMASVPASPVADFKRDETAWQLIQKRAQALYSVEQPTTNGSSQTLTIDASFQFSVDAQDSHFYFNHVEDLLSDAASLLDRCLRDRDAWNEHLVKRFNITAELREYFALDKIHKEETAAGFYTVASNESSSVLNGEIANQLGMYSAAGYIDWLISNKYTDDELNNQSGKQQLLGWISHLASYEKPPGGNFMTYTYNGASDTLPNFAHDAAFITSWHQFQTQLSLLQSQQKAQNTSSSVSAERSAGYRARADWDVKDSDFRRRRTQVARDTADIRSHSFTESGGALNFAERMQPIQDRFLRDYRDALARLYAAQKGLNLIFGYTVPLPASLSDLRKPGPNTNSATFDSCLGWVRDATTWLSAFTQNDQSYVLPISVKRAVGKTGWDRGLRTGQWTFNIPEGVFQDQRHVRVRGLSAFVAFDQSAPDPARDNSTWQVTLLAPDQGRTYHLDNSQVQIPQDSAPPSRLGRVTVRNSLTPPDIVGAIGLKNLSPIGGWRLGISKVSTEGIPLARIKDIYVDLHLTVRSSPAQRAAAVVPLPDIS